MESFEVVFLQAGYTFSFT